MDNLGNPFSCKFISLIESFDLVQHVLDPTHIAGHTLDLVLTRREEHLLADCFVADQLSDHSAVHWILKANRPLRPRKPVTLRRLKTVDRGLLLSDLLDLPFVASPADEVHTLLQQYNSGITDVLDVHAPTIMKTYTVPAKLCLCRFIAIWQHSFPFLSRCQKYALTFVCPSFLCQVVRV